jgi:hypothetical protein
MPIVSKAIENAKADIDRLSVETDGWAKDFVELLDGVKHLDLVFSEAQGMDIAYIALCDWADPSAMLVIQTIPVNATREQRQMAIAITSVITAALFRLGHFDVAVALLGETEGKVFHHETIGARCRWTMGCSRIAEAPTQFNFSSIRGHISRSPSPVVLN